MYNLIDNTTYQYDNQTLKVIYERGDLEATRANGGSSFPLS